VLNISVTFIITALRCFLLIFTCNASAEICARKSPCCAQTTFFPFTSTSFRLYARATHLHHFKWWVWSPTHVHTDLKGLPVFLRSVVKWMTDNLLWMNTTTADPQLGVVNALYLMHAQQSIRVAIHCTSEVHNTWKKYQLLDLHF